LAAGIGLGLLVAGLMIVIWWTLTQKDRPLRVVRDDPALETLLASAPAIRLNGGERPVTIISPRAATALEQWLSADSAELAANGREVRAIIVPSGHGGTSEEATVDRGGYRACLGLGNTHGGFGRGRRFPPLYITASGPSGR